MQRMNNSTAQFLLNEVSILKNENIIDEQTEKKLSSYYNDMLQANINETEKQKKAIESDKKHNHMNTVAILLGIVSAIFFGGAIITFIAFNWNFIPRDIKAVSAIFILIITQSIALFYLFVRKKDLSAPLKEGFSLFWTIIFGAILAFIGQIYRTPDNFSIFLLVWAISTIGVTYIFRSISTLIFYLVLMLGYTITMTYDKAPGTFYYLFFLLIIPLYLLEYKNITFRKKTLYHYLFVILSSIGIGLAFEKTIPGVWIIAYTNLYVLLFLIGNLIEKDNKNIFYSPFKLGGITGIIVMASMLIYNWVWNDVGWKHLRSGLLYNNFAAVFDYIIAILLILANLVIAYILFVKNKDRKDHNIIISAMGIIIPVIYIMVSMEFINPMIANFIITLLILASIIFLVTRKIITSDDSETHIVLPALLIIPIIIKVIIQTNELWVFSLIILFSFFYMTGIIINKRGSFISPLLFRIIGAIGIFLTVSSTLFIFDRHRNSIIFDFNLQNSIFNLIILVIVLICEIISISYFLYKHRKADNLTVSICFISILIPLLIILNSTGLISGSITSLVLLYSILLLIIFNLIMGVFFKPVFLSILTSMILLVPLLIKSTINTPETWALNIALFIAFLYTVGVYFQKKFKEGFNKFLEIFSTIFMAIFLYGFSFRIVSEMLMDDLIIKNLNSSLFIFTIIFLLLAIIIIKSVIEKIKINFTIYLLPLVLVLVYSGSFYKWAGESAILWSINLIIFMFCFYGFYLGVTNKSSLIINCSAIFLMLTVLTRFFELDVNLLVKATVFFICGILISGLNIIIMKTFNKKKKEGV